jgi:hypothetical protein
MREPFRRRRGLDALSRTNIGHDNTHERPHYSLIYDHFIGRELFDYLLGLLERVGAADPMGIRSRVADAFHRMFPDADAFFPSDMTYYFSDQTRGDEFSLTSTGRAPEWR